MLDLHVIGVTFAAIFLVELPDKTFIAALVLSTRYKAFAVWVGVGLAFLVQTVVAVTAGALASLLPEELIKSVAIAIFAIGAVILIAVILDQVAHIVQASRRTRKVAEAPPPTPTPQAQSASA